MKVKLRMDLQTATRLLDAMETLLHALPSPEQEAIVEVEFKATKDFALNCDRPQFWHIWR